MPNIYPIILAGGIGTRMWPLSRESSPKQFHVLQNALTLLQEAALRVAHNDHFQPAMVIANVNRRFLVAEQLREIGVNSARIVLESTPRNTAPAVAVAAQIVATTDPDGILLVMPAHHTDLKFEQLLATLQAALPSARAGDLVVMGAPPDVTDIEAGHVVAGAPIREGALVLQSLIQGPLPTPRLGAVAYDCYLNPGVYLLPVATLISELERLAPVVLSSAAAAIATAQNDLDFIRLGAAAFERSPTISFEQAVLQETTRAVVVPTAVTYRGIDTWSKLWSSSARDTRGNAVIGDVVAHGTRGSYLRSEGPLIATVGVDDLVIVATDDAVLVANRQASHDISGMVHQLKAMGAFAATQSPRIDRPWGWYEGLNSGERFQVKRITVKSGGRLSLQKHSHRSEHWVVVSGVAEVQVDSETTILNENDYIYIPKGSIHRLSNLGGAPLNLIEVQYGEYLGEDDIIRLEDAYDRV